MNDYTVEINQDNTDAKTEEESSNHGNTDMVLNASITDIDQDTSGMGLDPNMANTHIVELSSTLMEENQDAGSESDGTNDIDNVDHDMADNGHVEETGGDNLPDGIHDSDLGSQLDRKEGTYSTGIQTGPTEGQTVETAYLCTVSRNPTMKIIEG